MNDIRPDSLDAPLDRRGALARLAGVALSLSGLTAFRRFTPDAAKVRAPKWDDRFELAVDLEIAAQEGYRYHRPYVAVWVEDANGKPVRTLSVWVNTSGRGPRYFRELRRWFSMERDQQDAGGPDLIATVSSATRLPGQYTITWNGRDDRGNVVDQGNYRVIVEAAREHGSYQLMQQDLTLGARPVAADLGGNEEIGRARVEYRRRK
jgi:thiamine biosynthesis lipoprotein